MTNTQNMLLLALNKIQSKQLRAVLRKSDIKYWGTDDRLRYKFDTNRLECSCNYIYYYRNTKRTLHLAHAV